jgi:hypothetical protein
MQNNPNSIKGSIKLKSLSDPSINKDAYNNGFIDLASVEPSLGLPTGTTNTIPNSAYYFPVVGIDSYYANSRKFTGDDSLVLKNGNLGINNNNPIYDLDINGNLNVLSGANIATLSAISLVPSSLSNTLSVGYPGGVYFNSDAYFNNSNFIKNVTASNLFANSLSTNSLVYNNKITITYTLSNANVNSLNISGSLTATNITVLSSLKAFSVSATNTFTNSLTANSMSIANQLSVGGDIYAKSIHGVVDLDPNSSLTYVNNALSINTNNDYYFALRPSDSYSTDDVNVIRNKSGLFDSTVSINETYIYKPFFKTLGGALNYVKNNNLSGRSLIFLLDEDIIEGEKLRPSVLTPNDNSGKYSSGVNTGNMVGAFYSTEWLGTNYPAMTAAGVKGGMFYWSPDGINRVSGYQEYMNFVDLNFRYIYIQGRTEIGISKGLSNYSPALKSWASWPYKIYDTPSPRISFRSYFNNTLALSGNFGNQNEVYNTWLSLSGVTTTRFARPIAFNNANSDINVLNVIMEFDSNGYDSSAIIAYNGRVLLQNVTVAALGTAPYSFGAVCCFQKPAQVYIQGVQTTLDPFYFNNGTTYYNLRTTNGIIDQGEPTYYPGYFAVVGNSKRKSPTSFLGGIIRVMDGGYINYYDYGLPFRAWGFQSFITCCPIIDGDINATSFFKIENNSLARDITTYLVSGTSLGFNLSSYDVNYGNPTSPFTTDALNFKYIDLGGSFNNVLFPMAGKLYPWEIKGATLPSGTGYTYYYPFNYNGKHNGDSRDSYVYNTSNYTVNLSAYIYGNNTNGIVSYTNAVGNNWTLAYRPLSLGNGKDNNSSLVPFEYYFNIQSPQTYLSPQSNYVYKLNYYTQPAR